MDETLKQVAGLVMTGLQCEIDDSEKEDFILETIKQVHDAAVKETARECDSIAQSVKVKAGNENGELLNRVADQISRYIKQHFGLTGEGEGEKVESKWCEHIKFLPEGDPYKSLSDSLWLNETETADDNWNFCPICGKERPR